MLTILIGVVVVFMIAVIAVALGGRKRRSDANREANESAAFAQAAADELSSGESVVTPSDPTTPSS